MSKLYPIAEGLISWPAEERQTDRYGRIYLQDVLTRRPIELAAAVKHLVGKVGRLSAVVIEPRPSSHVGDWARGIYPSLPGQGEDIALGEGTFLVRNRGGIDYIELQPTDGRQVDWFDPKGLYRAHGSWVALWFESTN